MQAVLNDANEQDCHRLVCLGDIVDGGNENEQVARYVRDHNIDAVYGNHDEFNSLELPQDVADYLKGLPEFINEGKVIYTHISPRPKRNKINSPYEAWNVFDEAGMRLLFVGHVHVPLIYGERCEESSSAMDYPVTHNKRFSLDPNDRYIVSVGAVGYSRDGVPKPRYCIYDTENETVEIRIVAAPVLTF